MSNLFDMVFTVLLVGFILACVLFIYQVYRLMND
jgi:hypothetical protein